MSLAGPSGERSVWMGIHGTTQVWLIPVLRIEDSQILIHPKARHVHWGGGGTKEKPKSNLPLPMLKARSPTL